MNSNKASNAEAKEYSSTLRKFGVKPSIFHAEKLNRGTKNRGFLNVFLYE